jgi:hypothetical protein
MQPIFQVKISYYAKTATAEEALEKALDVISKRQGGDVYACGHTEGNEEPVPEEGALTEMLKDRKNRSRPDFDDDDEYKARPRVSFGYGSTLKEKKEPTSGFKVVFEWTGLAWTRDEALDVILKCLEDRKGCLVSVADLSNDRLEPKAIQGHLDASFQEHALSTVK